MTQAARRLGVDGESADAIAALLDVMTQLIDAHRGLVDLVAALQGDVLGLVESRERSPGETRDDARALRGEAAQAAHRAQRLIADAESLAGRTGAV